MHGELKTGGHGLESDKIPPVTTPQGNSAGSACVVGWGIGLGVVSQVGVQPEGGVVRRGRQAGLGLE